MAETVCVQGILRRGNPCWALERQDAERIFLIGDLTQVRDGQRVIVCGTPAEVSFCDGNTLAVSFIAANSAGGDALPKSVTRHIQITATLSERDLSPSFRLEQRDVNLHAVNGTWRTTEKDVHVEGSLDVFFSSKGWKNQKFVVSVVATDPADPTKTWSKEYPRVVEKGHVVIDEKMDVGAAETPGGVA